VIFTYKISNLMIEHKERLSAIFPITHHDVFIRPIYYKADFGNIASSIIEIANRCVKISLNETARWDYFGNRVYFKYENDEMLYLLRKDWR